MLENYVPSFGTGELLTLVERYRNSVLKYCRGKPSMRLYEYISRVFDGSLENTDDEDSNQSLEMQRLSSEQTGESLVFNNDLHLGSDEIPDEDSGQTADKKMKRSESADYKANTP